MAHPNDECVECRFGMSGHALFCSWRSRGRHVATLDGHRGIKVHIREVPSVEAWPEWSLLALVQNVSARFGTKAPFPVVSLSPGDYTRLQTEITATGMRSSQRIEPPTPKASGARCPDCNGTGVYVGLGFAPAEACRLCGGRGTMNAASPPVLASPQLGMCTPREGDVQYSFSRGCHVVFWGGQWLPCTVTYPP